MIGPLESRTMASQVCSILKAKMSHFRKISRYQDIRYTVMKEADLTATGVTTGEKVNIKVKA